MRKAWKNLAYAKPHPEAPYSKEEPKCRQNLKIPCLRNMVDSMPDRLQEDIQGGGNTTHF